MPSAAEPSPADTDEIARLRIIIRTLKKKNLNITQEDIRLGQENLRLKTEILELGKAAMALKEDNMKLVEENLQLDKDNSRLLSERQNIDQELRELKDKARLEGPLVKVGVAIRLRFWEQARASRGKATANKKVVEAGNHAAHRGDNYADTSLISLGYVVAMHKDTSSNEENSQITNIGSSILALYCDLYTVHFQKGFDVQSEYCPKAVEILNMSATMASCSPVFVAGPSGSGSGKPKVGDHVDDYRFNKLAGKYVDMLCNFPEADGVDYEGKLRELREIADRTVRRSFKNNRNKRM